MSKTDVVTSSVVGVAATVATPTSTDFIGVYAETFNDVSPADGKATVFSKEDVSPGVSALVSGEASAR